MKIKVCTRSFDEVMAMKDERHKKPGKPSFFFRTLIRLISAGELKETGFTYRMRGMEKLGKREPCLILMNHSSFIDLKIAFRIFYPRPLNIVCTSDGLVGKDFLMRRIGCIPTQKFVTDVTLVRDMLYAAKKNKSSILMYPEASYSFDGTATPLPESLGKFLKVLDVPVVFVRTYGAFHRDPLYNNLQLRKVNVSADVEYLLSQDDIRSKTPEELNLILKEKFTFDNFRWQQENGVRITEPFRADFLNRVLYRCPHCNEEGRMKGKCITLKCEACGTEHELTEEGFLKALNGDEKINHIPDWYKWQRECVRKELEDGSYTLEEDVDIIMMKGKKAVYRVGSGHLSHTKEGFHLTGCNGKLDYRQKPQASYSLYADYFWYELGDMVCIGNNKILYYCFPKSGRDIAAKTRLAVEELYRMVKN